jgi:hypothetical protein
MPSPNVLDLFLLLLLLLKNILFKFENFQAIDCAKKMSIDSKHDSLYRVLFDSSNFARSITSYDAATLAPKNYSF